MGTLGYKHSEETKRKISKANKGRVGFWSGKKRPHTSETKEKIRQAIKKQWNLGIRNNYPPSKKVLRAIDTVADFVGDISFGRIKPKL